MDGLMSSFANGDWDSAARNFLNEDTGVMLHQLFNDEGSSSENPVIWSSLENSTIMPGSNCSIFHPLDTFNLNPYQLPHSGSSNQSGLGVVPSLSYDKYYSTESCHIQEPNYICVPVEFYMMDVDVSPVPSFLNAIEDEATYVNGLELHQAKLDNVLPIPGTQLNLKRVAEISTSENPKKKYRAVKDPSGNKRNAPSKNKQKPSLGGSDDEFINANDNTCKHVSYSYSSEDDSSVSQELSGGTSDKLVTPADQNGKKTGRRGSAIDPQSLYARKRRERINERLRILQNLVPNGTKVDISTMLEEAVHYVKFLQTQIKLLSSDDLWMYAPIAYNGIDLGLLDRKISQNL